MLTPADLAAHAQLGISAEILALAQVRRVTDPEARALLAINGQHGRSLEGVIYPYLNPLDQRIWTYRLRRDHPEIEGGKPKNKYLSAYGDRRHLYFGVARSALLEDPTMPIIHVEAEKSCLAITCAADRSGRAVLPIALGGCWSWRGKIGKVETPDGGRADELGPLPDLDHVAWTGRDVVIAFDANAAVNQKVQSARRTFGFELARRGARVRFFDLPQDEGINGPDDFIGLYGADRFFALIDRAPEASTVDRIFRLNRTHAVVQEAGKTLVVTEDHDPILDRDVLFRSSFGDFRNFYLRESVQVGSTKDGDPIMKSLGHFWLTHSDRRQYEGIVMSPNLEMPGYLNLWRGFAVRPAPGCCERFKEHLLNVICAGNAELYHFVFAWCAAMVQAPDRPAESALVFRGGRGTGKGIVGRTLGALFGQHYLQIANSKHLVGHFNAHLQDTILLFADEAFFAGDKASESTLKMLITEPVIPIERKGHDVTLAKNLLHIIMASNSDWVVPAGIDERRFCVLDVVPLHRNDHAYFAAIYQELEAGGLAALLNELLHYPLANVNLREVPMTEALREQKVLSFASAERWLFDKLMAGRWLPHHTDWDQTIVKEALHEDYIVSLQRLGVDRRSTETELGMFIGKMFGETVSTKRPTINNKREWVWDFADLDACRTAFNQATHSTHPWPQDEPKEG